MINYLFPILFSTFLLTGFQTESIADQILNGLKNNDSKSLVKHFGTSVKLTLKGEERISTKFQSELLLTEFFKDYRITEIKISSVGGHSQPNNYVIYSIKNAKENLTAVVKFLEIKGETLVVDFKIY